MIRVRQDESSVKQLRGHLNLMLFVLYLTCWAREEFGKFSLSCSPFWHWNDTICKNEIPKQKSRASWLKMLWRRWFYRPSPIIVPAGDRKHLYRQSPSRLSRTACAHSIGKLHGLGNLLLNSSLGPDCRQSPSRLSETDINAYGDPQTGTFINY